jgi:hypothetical protein
MLINTVATHDLTYAQWMRKVDLAVTKRIGCSIYDLTDCPLRDWFEAGLSPAEAATEALENEGMGEDEDDEYSTLYTTELFDYFPESACAPEGMYPDAYDGVYEL